LKLSPALSGSDWNFLTPLGADFRSTSWTSVSSSDQTQSTVSPTCTVSLDGP
jgi:hypothetical protein